MATTTKSTVDPAVVPSIVAYESERTGVLRKRLRAQEAAVAEAIVIQDALKERHSAAQADRVHSMRNACDGLPQHIAACETAERAWMTQMSMVSAARTTMQQTHGELQLSVDDDRRFELGRANMARLAGRV